MYAVPLMGQQITITRLLRGDAVTAFEVGLCFACTALAALVVYLVTAWIYRGERLAISVEPPLRCAARRTGGAAPPQKKMMPPNEPPHCLASLPR